MAVTTMDGLVAALTAGDTRSFNKAAVASLAAGQRHSMWMVGGNPGAGAAPANPTTGVVPTSATAGAIPFVNAVANNYLGYIAASGGQAGSLIIYDRLWHSSGNSVTALSGTPQTITPTALTRHTDGAGVELWVEVYTSLGVATAATITVTYTDQDGTTGQTGTIAKPATAGDVGEMWGPMQFAAGDYGLRAITSFFWSATQTSGSIGFTLVKKICTIPIATTNVAAIFDAFTSGLREIQDNACLALMAEVNATTMGPILGELTIAKG